MAEAAVIVDEGAEAPEEIEPLADDAAAPVVQLDTGFEAIRDAVLFQELNLQGCASSGHSSRRVNSPTGRS